MSKRVRLSPHKTLYTLDEAAKASGYTPAELLRFGVLGTLAFCTRIPDSIAVFSVDKVFLPGGRWHKGVSLVLAIELVYCQGPLLEDRIDTLTLDKEHCREIEALGRVSAYAFGSGGRLHGDHSYSTVDPHDVLNTTENGPRRPMRRCMDDVSLPLIEPWPHSRLFVTYSREPQSSHPHSSAMGTPTNLELANETIYIEAGALARLLGEHDESGGEQRTARNLSKKLAQLNYAAELFWGETAQEQSWYPPKNKKVEAFLMEKKWPAYQAKYATSIIRPEHADVQNGPTDKRERMDPVSRELAALNDVAKEYWCDIDLDNRAEHPEDKEVAAHLKEAHGFSQVKANVGASIIRPVENKGGRRPGK